MSVVVQQFYDTFQRTLTYNVADRLVNSYVDTNENDYILIAFTNIALVFIIVLIKAELEKWGDTLSPMLYHGLHGIISANWFFLKTTSVFAVSYFGIIISRLLEGLLLDGNESMQIRAIGIYVVVCLFYAVGYAYDIVPVLEHTIIRKKV